MNRVVMILAACFVCVAAHEVKAQEDSLSLKDALNIISEAKSVQFTYERQLVGGKRVSYDRKLLVSQAAEQSISEILRQTGLTYEKIGDRYFTIIRSRKKPSPVRQVPVTGISERQDTTILMRSSAPATADLQGHVIERASGDPLEAATVSIAELGFTTLTDSEGRFEIRKLPAGELALRIQLIGMVSYEQKLLLAPGGTYQTTASLETSSLRLKEVNVVANELTGNGPATSVITRQAIEHLQATSLADVLQLLPGVLAKNPDLSGVNQYAVRQIASSNMGSLGTAVIVNGAPLSNNANLQSGNTARSGVASSFSSTSGSGIDLRQIPADNIESVEVIRGVPSAEYGDLTNGAVIIKTKAGKSPFNAKARINPNLTQFWLGKGFAPGKKGGSLNAGIDYIHSVSDPRFETEGFKRITTDLLYSQKFFSNTPLITNTSLAYSMTLDELKQDPDDANYQVANRSKEYFFRFNSDGRWNLQRKFAGTLGYSFSLNYGVQNGYNQQLISSGAAPVPYATKDTTMVSMYTDPVYLSQVWVEGRPLNIFAKLTDRFYLHTGTVRHSFLAGAEWRTDANSGKGRTFEASRPPGLSADGNANRPRSYKDIPALRQLSFYAEDNVRGQLFDKTFFIQAGIRFDNIQPAGLWKSDKGTAWSPRVNASYGLTDALTLRGGWGKTAKAPGLVYLYPQEAYFDLININHYTEDPAERLLVTTTRVFNTENSGLRIATNNKKEAGFDWRFGNGRHISVTVYHERLKNGYSFKKTLESVKIMRLEKYAVAERPPGQPPVLAETPASVENRFADFNMPVNDVSAVNKGVEFDINPGRFEALRTSFVLNGAWMESTSVSTDHYLLKKASSSGSVDPDKLAVYSPGRGVRNRQLNTTLRTVHNIPEFRFVVSLTAQALWISKNDYVGYERIPVAYIQRSDGQVVWLSDDERAAITPASQELYQNISDEYYVTESWKPLWLFNLKLTKEAGRFMSFSFYANNVFMHRPLEQSSRWKDQYTRRNQQLFFGTEISFKF